MHECLIQYKHTHKHIYTHVQAHTQAHIHTYMLPYAKMVGRGLVFPVLGRVGLQVYIISYWRLLVMVILTRGRRLLAKQHTSALPSRLHNRL